jgi:hypothetical protein
MSSYIAHLLPTDTAVPLVSSYQSLPLKTDRTEFVSIQATWTGTPTGSFTIQLSNDPTDNPSVVSNWTDYSGSALAVAGAGGTNMWNMQCAAKWFRLNYNFTSGTGTLTSVWASSK